MKKTKTKTPPKPATKRPKKKPLILPKIRTKMLSEEQIAKQLDKRQADGMGVSLREFVEEMLLRTNRGPLVRVCMEKYAVAAVTVDRAIRLAKESYIEDMGAQSRERKARSYRWLLSIAARAETEKKFNAAINAVKSAAQIAGDLRPDTVNVNVMAGTAALEAAEKIHEKILQAKRQRRA